MKGGIFMAQTNVNIRMDEATKKAFDALRNNKLLAVHTELNTQLVLSTHSNHVVNELDLNSMRYFRRVVDSTLSIPISKVVNLSNTFGTDEETKRFVTR